MKRMIVAALALVLTALWGVIATANDEQIAQQIVEKLQEQRQSAQLKDFNIGVQVEEGTVTMMGSVADPNHAILALDIARRIAGVKLVVNDLYVQAQPGSTTPATAAPSPAATNTVTNPPTPPAAASPAVQPAQAMVPAPRIPATPVSTSQPAAQPVTAAPATRAHLVSPSDARNLIPLPTRAAIGSGVSQPAPPSRPQTPRAFARTGITRQASHVAPEYAAAGSVPYSYSSGQGPGPVPMMSAGGSGIARASFDNPQMPGYAWPSYAAYPNYAAVTYPQQYSATAWPYIGPFYPYPQVPLGWRKVMLEWDDGWWFLDFKSK